MVNFDEHKILNEPNELINEIVDWVKKRNKIEHCPIEAVAITLSYTGLFYKTSYMCFDWEKEILTKSINLFGIGGVIQNS